MALGKYKRIFGILKVSVILVIATALVILTVSAVGKKEPGVISAISIHYAEDAETHYIREDQILSAIRKLAKSDFKNISEDSVDLALLEAGLNKNKWIDKAQLFVDNKGILNVEITQKNPIARVFSEGGSSFFLSDDMTVLPLNGIRNLSLPTFTGFKGNMNLPKADDSLLFNDISTLAEFINSSSFWKSQIEQIVIDNHHQFELIPRLGNQTIQFGGTDAMDVKFNKLMVFYEQVSKEIGWDRYDQLDLRYDKQVVATRRDAAKIKSDSLATMRNMANAVKEAKRQEEINNIQVIQRSESDSSVIKTSTEKTIDTREANILSGIDSDTGDTISSAGEPKAVMPEKKSNREN